MDMDMPGTATMGMDMGNSTMDHGMMGNSTMDHGGMDHGDMDHSGMDHSMMHMWFYFGVTNVTVLFKSWTIQTSGQMVGACFAVAILAALYEGLKVLRELLLRNMSAKNKTSRRQTEYQNGIADSAILANPPRSTIWSWGHLLQTFLHLVQVFISYMLMLIFMTYNGYLAIAILLGACIGYFVFGWKKAVIIDINEHCH